MLKLRLGYLVPEFPGQTHAFFWREIRALRRMGEDVSLLSTRKPSPMTCRHEFAGPAMAETRYLFPPAAANLATWACAGLPRLSQALEYIRGLALRDVKARLRQCALLAAAIDLVQWARQQRIDHVHAHSCADAAHVLALSHLMGGPRYSLTLHGDLDVYGTDHRSKSARAAFLSAVGSHLRAELVERAGVQADRVFATFMGVDTAELATLGAERRHVSGELNLATIARLHPFKGHVYALGAVRRALQQGLEVRYTIAGDGPHRDAIASCIVSLGLERHVTLAGTLSEKEVYKLLSNSDAFVLPSIGLGEAWPVSVMEAMGAGLPVIASMIGATHEMIAPGHDGFLVPQGSEDALLEAISLLALDVSLRRRIGLAARATALKRFDVGVTAAALREAIYAAT